MSWKIAAFSIFVFGLQHVIRVLYSFGYHLQFYQHYPGPCQQVEGIDFGSASFHTLPDGLTLITSGFSMNIVSGSFQSFYRDREAEGKIFMVDLNNSSKTYIPVPLTIEVEDSSFNLETFRPHGISVWCNKDVHIVFVVSHPLQEADRVEKFLLDRDALRLTHVTTYRSPKLWALYDVHALGEDSFYVSNVLYEHRWRPGMILELFSLMPWSTVVLYEADAGYRQVVGGLTSATGVLASPCGRYIYVLSCLGKEVRVYSRQEDNSLTLQQLYPLSTHPDLAAVDPLTGDVLVGAHPVLYQYLRHMEWPMRHKAPSQVLHLRVRHGNISSALELLYDDGHLISGSSTAVVYKGTLMVGSTMGGMVVCQVNVPL